MRKSTRHVFWMLLPAVLLLLTLNAAPVSAFAPDGAPFQRTWARTDQPIAEGIVNRTWIWGPDAFTEAMDEPYEDAPDGRRAVQYFDKARMEITQPDGDPNALWFVTNGLLVVELVTGRVQVGDNEFYERWPAEVNVAGDADDPNGPTYATFKVLMPYQPFPVGGSVTQRISRDVQAHEDTALGRYGVTVAVLDEATQHTVASVFWEFMNAEGLVSIDGTLTSDRMFPDPYYATGRPIAEPYWAAVRVGGQTRDVLIQCFERRCLTYTPDNPPGWQVEAGNVGRHYYTWRYEPDLSGTMLFSGGSSVIVTNPNGTNWRVLDPFANHPDERGAVIGVALAPGAERLAFERWLGIGTPSIDLFVIGTGGGGLVRITDCGPQTDVACQATDPAWSPDGNSLAFIWTRGEDRGLYIADAEGSDIRRVPVDLPGYMHSPTWSPDGTRLALIATTQDGDWLWDTIWTVAADGSDTHEVLYLTIDGLARALDWSPDGSTLAFQVWRDTDQGSVWDIYTLSVDGSDLQRVLTGTPQFSGTSPRWSPDGRSIAFIHLVGNGLTDTWVMSADGSHLRQLNLLWAYVIDWVA